MTVPQAPRLSVLLPCRDAEPWLEACIESLRAQTERRFEVLAVDDGSRDDTLARLRAWGEEDARVHVIEGDGSGIVDALRLAAARARGSHLARMDADDVARPERFRRQLALLDGCPELAGCGTRIRYMPRDALGSGYRRYERWLNGLVEPDELRRDLFVECPIAHPTLVVRRGAYDAVGGYRPVDWPEDYDLILRLHAAGHALANVPETLLEWRVRPGRLSMSSERYDADAFRRCKAHHLARGFLPSARPLVVWGAGKVGKAFARAVRRELGAAAVAAFVDLDPRKIGQRIHGAPVWSPDGLAARLGAPEARRPYVLAAVGSPGARDDIRAALGRLGLAELDDFRAVA